MLIAKITKKKIDENKDKETNNKKDNKEEKENKGILTKVKNNKTGNANDAKTESGAIKNNLSAEGKDNSVSNDGKGTILPKTGQGWAGLINALGAVSAGGFGFYKSKKGKEDK